ncbi:FAD synthase [Candidatus Bathyarchaeota archaeon]|nr:MAG: FAD synthase [Candidatus Bathyarchaeota archaeon]
MTEKKGKVVLTTGVFDILHYGHVRLLEEAKKVGGEDAKLVVIVARDKTVEKRKGKRPVLPEWERRAIVAALRVVDEALLGFEEMDMERVIELVRPDIIAVGYDQDDIEAQLRRLIEEKGYDVQIVKMRRYGSEDLDSSSKIKGRIIENWRGRS